MLQAEIHGCFIGIALILQTASVTPRGQASRRLMRVGRPHQRYETQVAEILRSHRPTRRNGAYVRVSWRGTGRTRWSLENREDARAGHAYGSNRSQSPDCSRSRHFAQRSEHVHSRLQPYQRRSSQEAQQASRLSTRIGSAPADDFALSRMASTASCFRFSSLLPPAFGTGGAAVFGHCHVAMRCRRGQPATPHDPHAAADSAASSSLRSGCPKRLHRRNISTRPVVISPS